MVKAVLSSDQAHALLRIATGLMFWQHGAQKLLGWFGSGPVEGVIPLTAGVLEFAGGILIAVGFRVRVVAFVLAGQMAVAYWWRHVGATEGMASLVPIMNRGELAVLYCALYLYFWTRGAGIMSLDKRYGIK